MRRDGGSCIPESRIGAGLHRDGGEELPFGYGLRVRPFIVRLWIFTSEEE